MNCARRRSAGVCMRGRSGGAEHKVQMAKSKWQRQMGEVVGGRRAARGKNKAAARGAAAWVVREVDQRVIG